MRLGILGAGRRCSVSRFEDPFQHLRITYSRTCCSTDIEQLKMACQAIGTDQEKESGPRGLDMSGVLASAE